MRIRRTATRGKTYKTSILSGFCEIECGGGSGCTPVMWQPLWQSWLPEIYPGGIVLVYFSKRLQTQNWKLQLFQNFDQMKNRFRSLTQELCKKYSFRWKVQDVGSFGFRWPAFPFSHALKLDRNWIMKYCKIMDFEIITFFLFHYNFAVWIGN